MEDVFKDQALTLLTNNHFSGINRQTGQKYSYTCPSRPKYPHQWLWDSCFAAIVWSKINPDYAKDELRSLLQAQRADGFVPSIIRWRGTGLLEKLPLANVLFDGLGSRITQPPVIAQALEEVYKNTGDLQFVAELLPKVAAYYDYLAQQRDPEGSHLVSIIHPWESTDASPAFDKTLFGQDIKRPNLVAVYYRFFKLLFDYSRGRSDFSVKDVLFNSIYAQGLGSLSRLYAEASQPSAATSYRQRVNGVLTALIAHCYDSYTGLFFNLIQKQDRSFVQSRAVTAASLFPLILDNLSGEIASRLVKEHLTNPAEFWLPHPVPFVAKSEASFNPSDNRLLWRGPTWVNINWFLVRGLATHGYDKLAKELAVKTLDLVKIRGCCEFYNPLTGKGGGQKNYSWSTLVLNLLNY